MSSNNFRRSNVNAKTLQITDPSRSSFNLGHKNDLSIPFGRVIPVSHRILMPSDTFQGSIQPNFHLEKIATPSIGPVRLDTHTFVVNFRRINRDMRKNLENSVNFFPSFNLSNFASNLFTLLGSYYSAVYHDSNNRTFSSFADWQNKCVVPQLPAEKTIRAYCNALSAAFFQSLYGIIETAQSNKKYSTLYYQLDKIEYLQNYYYNLADTFDKIVNADSTITNKNNDPRILFELYLPMLVKPFFGASSLFDYLGYPIYTQYSAVAQWYRLSSANSNAIDTVLTGRVSRFNDKDCDRWATAFFTDSFIKTFNPFFVIFTGRVYDVHQDNTLHSFALNFKTDFSELPLRAYYAVWYDYLRNWHIEERQNILDPDDFSNTAVIQAPANFNYTENNINSYTLLAKMLSFTTLQYRDYNSDFLTTIQSDDVFRHVYSPVFAAETKNSQYGFPVIGSDGNPQPNTINMLGIGSDIDTLNVSAYLPTDYMTNYVDTLNAPLYQDLTVMRRAGMLERWLARNYYFPDTYVGRLQARFGVRPSDYEILVSNYLGGSETFITGTELVANMSTSETIVGTRNLKADVSLTDNFSGTVSDYSYLISVVSTVPIVSYDVLHPSTTTIDFVDFPQPEFATDTRVEARTSDFLRGFEIKPFIGYVPRYYMFRTAADETHGRYLTDYRAFNWFRDNYSMSLTGKEFTLTPYSLRVHLPLDAFIGLSEYDDFAYGDCDCQLSINRALPAALEII